MSYRPTPSPTLVTCADEGLRDVMAGGFIPAPRELVNDPTLSGNALRVFLGIMGHYNPGARCAWPSQDRLALELGLSRRTVWEAVKLLTERRILSYERHQRFNLYVVNKRTYWVVNTPATVPDLDDLDVPEAPILPPDEPAEMGNFYTSDAAALPASESLEGDEMRKICTSRCAKNAHKQDLGEQEATVSNMSVSKDHDSTDPAFSPRARTRAEKRTDSPCSLKDIQAVMDAYMQLKGWDRLPPTQAGRIASQIKRRLKMGPESARDLSDAIRWWSEDPWVQEHAANLSVTTCMDKVADYTAWKRRGCPPRPHQNRKNGPRVVAPGATLTRDDFVGFGAVGLDAALRTTLWECDDCHARSWESESAIPHRDECPQAVPVFP